MRCRRGCVRGAGSCLGVRAVSLLGALLSYFSPSPPPPAVDETDRHKQALASAGDFLKVSTGLATGALVFSLGLLPSVQVEGTAIHVLLTLTWAALFVSVVGGILSQAAIPVLMYDGVFDLEAPTFTWPGRIHQVLFGLAMLGLAVVLIATLNAGAPKIGNAAGALARARTALRAGEVPDRLEEIALLGGTPAGWHVRFHLRDGGSVDVVVDAAKGAVSRIPT
jgi:hypothetical protein